MEGGERLPDILIDGRNTPHVLLASQLLQARAPVCPWV